MHLKITKESTYLMENVLIQLEEFLEVKDIRLLSDSDIERFSQLLQIASVNDYCWNAVEELLKKHSSNPQKAEHFFKINLPMLMAEKSRRL